MRPNQQPSDTMRVPERVFFATLAVTDYEKRLTESEVAILTRLVQ